MRLSQISGTHFLISMHILLLGKHDVQTPVSTTNSTQIIAHTLHIWLSKLTRKSFINGAR
jgi:hypothetical protein